MKNVTSYKIITIMFVKIDCMKFRHSLLIMELENEVIKKYGN